MTITLHIDDNTPQRVLRAVTTMLHQLQQTAPVCGEGQQWPTPYGVTDAPFVEPRGPHFIGTEDGGIKFVPDPRWEQKGAPQFVETEVHEAVAPLPEPVRQQLHGLDSAGLPWDERIHSDTKATNADGTWRLRRNINVKAPGLVERVRAEQLAALAAPAVTLPSPVIDVPVPPAPPPPAPVVEAPVPVAPPPPSVSTTDAVDTPEAIYRHVILRITEDTAKGALSPGATDAALASLGLTSIRDLSTRLDLVIPFERALYGE